MVASDIHGEGARLQTVLAAAEYNPARDRLFLLGDYMDRGTDSKQTLLLVRQLVAHGAIALRGNHDEMPLICARDWSQVPWWISNGGGKTIQDWGGVVPRSALVFLNSLPYCHEEPDCILVHAGLKPGVTLDRQTHKDLLWIRSEFHDHYTGKRVIFGHTPTVHLHGRWALWAGVDKLGIDTGAAYGGPLTLVDIDSGRYWQA